MNLETRDNAAVEQGPRTEYLQTAPAHFYPHLLLLSGRHVFRNHETAELSRTTLSRFVPPLAKAVAASAASGGSEAEDCEASGGPKACKPPYGRLLARSLTAFARGRHGIDTARVRICGIDLSHSSENANSVLE
jgi:hypothetical protein